MTKVELIKRLQEIKKRGFIQSTRSGTTGIGHTLETLLEVPESNIAIPDIGARFEIKATRRESNSLITLFTFNKGVWLLDQKEMIMKYGYKDSKGRYALKNTLFYGKTSSQNISLLLDRSDNIIKIVDNEGNTIGTYDLWQVIAKFLTKLGRVLFCIADTQKDRGIEFFHFNEFYLLQDTEPRKFINAFEEGLVGIDLRMHLKDNGAVRNRGTAFRMKEVNLIELYKNVERLV